MKAHLVILDMEKPSKMIVLNFFFYYSMISLFINPFINIILVNFLIHHKD